MTFIFTTPSLKKQKPRRYVINHHFPHVGGHVAVGLLVHHDATVLGVPPAAEEGGGGYDDNVGVLVHADREAAAAGLGIVSGAVEVARGLAELVGVVGHHAAEALKQERKGREVADSGVSMCLLVEYGRIPVYGVYTGNRGSSLVPQKP